MSDLSKKRFQEIRRIMVDLHRLMQQATGEINRQQSYEYVEGVGYENRDKWEGHDAPETAQHPGYTKASAAIKRRSLDLTRALAEMRNGR